MYSEGKTLISHPDKDFTQNTADYISSWQQSVITAENYDAVAELARREKPTVIMVAAEDSLLAAVEFPDRLIVAVDDEYDSDTAADLLTEGVDQYMEKSLPPRLLYSTIKALERRHGGKKVIKPPIRIGESEIDLEGREISRNGESVHLQKHCFDVLEYFINNRGRIISKTQLMYYLDNDHTESPDTSSVRIAVQKIRQALGEKGKPNHLKNVHGMGYVLD